MEREIIKALVAYCQACDALSTDSETLMQELMDIFGYAFGMDEAQVEELID